jgi:hypothetical protein
MTLPFRRRHNDHEAPHDRARAIVAGGFIEPVETADAEWLAGHLAGCPECRVEADLYRADRDLLRGLRERTPEPPRDLWARTAVEIERERGPRDRSELAGASGGPGRGGPSRPRAGRLPLGAISGLLVVMVVVGVSLFPRGAGPGGAPGGNGGGTTGGSADATPITVVAHELAWLEAAPDGSYSLMQTSVREVCPSGADCAPLGSVTSTRLRFANPPQALVLSPSRQELVVVTSASSPGGADVMVVAVSALVPIEASASPTTSGEPISSSGATLGASPSESTASGTPGPAAPGPTPTMGSAEPSASLEPMDGRAIATGVIVVGDAAYSADGQWLAFAARPATGEVGPDLYLWRVGDPLATAVTSDHRTFFAGWLGNLVLASRIEPTVPGSSPAAPETSGAPASSPTGPPSPTTAPSPDGSPDASPDASPEEGPAPVEEHPVSFLLEPGTGAVIPMAGTDVWHPTVDRSGQFVAYWSGTLVPDGEGTTWHLGTGRLVLDRWQNGSPLPTDAATSSSTPSTTATPDAGAASPAPIAPVYGPAGSPVTIGDGAVPDFDARFDPTGTRLAIWVQDSTDPAVGTLRLLIIDQLTGVVDPSLDPLPGVPALRGVSIDAGRLVWITPPGPDGEGSHVQVLAWNDYDFGQARTISGQRILAVR